MWKHSQCKGKCQGACRQLFSGNCLLTVVRRGMYVASVMQLPTGTRLHMLRCCAYNSVRLRYILLCRHSSPVLAPSWKSVSLPR